MAIELGSRIGPYEVVALLGAGGMGEVYRARDTRLERDVAIKVLPEAVAANPDGRRRFEEEARAVAALNHPHICQIYDVGPTYLVLEYIDGTPLTGPMPTDIRRADEAIDEMERMLHEDPLHVLCRSQLAGCLHAIGRRADAWRHLQQVLEIDEDFWVAHFYRAVSAALDGALSEARTAAERAYSPMSKDMNAGLLAGILSREGDQMRSEQLLAHLQHEGTYGVPMGWFAYHLARMDFDEAAASIEQAIDQHDQRATYGLPYLRMSSRWPLLAKKLNLPAHAPA